MAYTCECGNKDTFLEVFDVAVDVVDGNDGFVRTDSRNVAHYVCTQCEKEIPYEEFLPQAVSQATPPQ
jgi:hypothetical protein